MKILVVGPSMTPEYFQWREQRVNDNIPMSNPETARSLKEHLQVLLSEIEIIKQDFEKRSLELGKKIEQLEEEKMQLGLDVDVQKLEVDKLRKGKNKAEEDLDSLKMDYKKLHRSMRTAGLGKTSEQWRQEIQEEKTKHRSRNSAVELKASLSKIEELRGKVGELEDALQNSELRIELLDRGNEQWQEQFHRSQDQIREIDFIMGEAVAQVREVADHLQTLAIQADVLSLKYESESGRGRELAWLLRKVKALSIREKPYM
ncbi:hypothetical protein Gotri_025904 [Gossypium trilobum]|uniref:Uncharacterized protein n=1 Tax=Gossypium trilobum TaxID=34281 RepID=A0A7J9FMH8_9ROSI|nr:hypothetical protein [Gossypium trilobum]